MLGACVYNTNEGQWRSKTEGMVPMYMGGKVQEILQKESRRCNEP